MQTRAMKRAGRGGSGSPPRKNIKPDPPADDAEDVCAICLDKPSLMKKKLKCGHSFCFLCIKGVYAIQSSCPLCRDDIDDDEFARPQQAFDIKARARVADEDDDDDDDDVSIIDDEDDDKEDDDEDDGDGSVRAPVTADSSAQQSSSSNAGNSGPGARVERRFFWLYESRGEGWWRFVPEFESQIEKAYKRRRPNIRMMIAGSMYDIDLEEMEQIRESDEATRSIKRVTEAEFDQIVADGKMRGIGGVENL